MGIAYGFEMTWVVFLIMLSLSYIKLGVPTYRSSHVEYATIFSMKEYQVLTVLYGVLPSVYHVLLYHKELLDMIVISELAINISYGCLFGLW